MKTEFNDIYFRMYKRFHELIFTYTKVEAEFVVSWLPS